MELLPCTLGLSLSAAAQTSSNPPVSATASTNSTSTSVTVTATGKENGAPDDDPLTQSVMSPLNTTTIAAIHRVHLDQADRDELLKMAIAATDAIKSLKAKAEVAI